MCQFKSLLILKNRIVLAPDGNESHSNLLESLNIEDNRENAMRMFVRAELSPKDGNKFSDVNEWTFRVDQDITPDWFDNDPERYEDETREAVKDYMKDYIKNNNLVKIADHYWTPIKKDGNRIYYLLDETLMNSEFGKNNNYAESYIREKLGNSDLAKKLKEELGDRLIPIRTDLLSLDGLDDYGKAEGDIIAIPTLDLYRECRKVIPKIDKWWWLSTSYSTTSDCSSGGVCCVGSDGDVFYDWYLNVRAVRPFIIVESPISESSEKSESSLIDREVTNKSTTKYEEREENYMSNINVINNIGKDVDIIVNGNLDKIEIIIDLANKDFKLPNNLKPGDIFKDIDGVEYILWYYLENGDAAITTKDPLTEMKFSNSNNNYNGCDIDKYLCNTYLPELERKFGKENIVEYEVDLLSLDGENDYGTIKRKVSILTLDQYRKNKKAIKKYIKEWFYLATPSSTPNSYSSYGVCCVGSSGGVNYYWYDVVKAVRPVFVLKSIIFESSKK